MSHPITQPTEAIGWDSDGAMYVTAHTSANMIRNDSKARNNPRTFSHRDVDDIRDPLSYPVGTPTCSTSSDSAILRESAVQQNIPNLALRHGLPMQHSEHAATHLQHNGSKDRKGKRQLPTINTTPIRCKYWKKIGKSAYPWVM
jgi:hypothetical protein